MALSISRIWVPKNGYSWFNAQTAIEIKEFKGVRSHKTKTLKHKKKSKGRSNSNKSTCKNILLRIPNTSNISNDLCDNPIRQPIHHCTHDEIHIPQRRLLIVLWTCPFCNYPCPADSKSSVCHSYGLPIFKIWYSINK